MKNSVFILVIMLCTAASAQDTICLPRNMYIEIYKGLKSAYYYKQKHAECIDIANSLNEVIQQQNDSLQLSIYRLQETEYELDYLNYQYQEAIKKQPVPWYKSGWLWAGVGLLTGLIIK